MTNTTMIKEKHKAITKLTLETVIYAKLLTSYRNSTQKPQNET